MKGMKYLKNGTRQMLKSVFFYHAKS